MHDTWVSSSSSSSLPVIAKQVSLQEEKYCSWRLGILFSRQLRFFFFWKFSYLYLFYRRLEEPFSKPLYIKRNYFGFGSNWEKGSYLTRSSNLDTISTSQVHLPLIEQTRTKSLCLSSEHFYAVLLLYRLFISIHKFWTSLEQGLKPWAPESIKLKIIVTVCRVTFATFVYNIAREEDSERDEKEQLTRPGILYWLLDGRVKNGRNGKKQTPISVAFG